ncbi:GNAT family N-acetyltransferase [Deinococcus peraridilitoris]|uniref:N-acetyltransferase domain-containing protein n=1 Tax=Deinococcus peraridilitoris (strain DSM 19664 / LMG 22246 / CIP 109416 / KR-200) TaxID=937777 RepID=L0A0U3_DEIPD|nr:hypothetical protein [Deinococcus peraridilitoris]AFZ67466.1 hypothetical protein Deipe_1963 [Deinococcus peraridilitoris DSM 19664]
MTHSLTPLQLMELQIPTLFVLDEDQRLRFVREPGYPEAELDPAPRFFMGRTPQGNTWRFRHDLPPELIGELEPLCSAEPISADLEGEPRLAPMIRAVLGAWAPITKEYRGPAYRLPGEVVTPQDLDVTLVTETNAAALLRAHFPQRITSRSGFRVGPCGAVLVEGQAVSLCYCARITDRAAEAGVETAPTFRGRGYASGAVIRWAEAVRHSGRLAFYSTEWGNSASRGVARRLAGVQYGEDWSLD